MEKCKRFGRAGDHSDELSRRHAAVPDVLDMAAAPERFFDEPRPVSPELALVDATMAAELRAHLSSPEDAARPPRNAFSEVLATSSPPAKLVEVVFGDALADPPVHGMDEVRDEHVSIDEGVSESARDGSSYPTLPAPQLDDQAVDATAAALLRIRERFESEP